MHFDQFGVHSAILLKYRDLLNQTGVNIRSKAELDHPSSLGLAGPLVRLRESMDSQSPGGEEVLQVPASKTYRPREPPLPSSTLPPPSNRKSRSGKVRKSARGAR
jgi:hypothetical protein